MLENNLNKDYVPFLEKINATDPLMWVVNIKAGKLVDLTPATAAMLQTLGPTRWQSTRSREFHTGLANEVLASGKSRTFVEWVKADGSWHKILRTKSAAGGDHVLEMGQDVTVFDPRAEWLARINLVDQRLEMKNGESISFPEFVVLNLLIKGYRYRRIADRLNISKKTVEYRISKLKIALEAETTEELMMRVSSSGLIYLATVPVDPANPALTELELYKKVPH
jgi:DNA-binding CsgD family transcriptional regulator